MHYVVSKIAGVKKNDRRLVLFIECGTDRTINGKQQFTGFVEKYQNTVCSRFEHWIDGNVHDLYFHGWNDEAKKHYFTFKWHEGKSRCRLYGFLYKPQDPRLIRLEVCVLAFFARKFTEETDDAIINALNALRRSSAVIKAVEEFLSAEYDLKRQNNEIAKKFGKKPRT